MDFVKVARGPCKMSAKLGEDPVAVITTACRWGPVL